MEKNRAPRNRTITLSPDEQRAYLSRCILPAAITDSLLPDNEPASIIHGDVFEAAARLPDAAFDLLIVDPPYNLSKTYSASTFSSMPKAAYRDFTERWLALMLPKLKATASVYVCCDWQSSLVIGALLEQHLHVRNRITWQREKGRGARTNWKNAMEDIWFATCSAQYTFNVDSVKMRRRVLAPYKVDGSPKDWQESAAGNFRDTCPSNFWDDISVPYWSMPENTDHPTQKPEKLLAKLILASSDVGGLVLDPFAGSGTTAVVAKKLGRRCIAIEREAEYCALAQRRLELADTSPDIQGYADGVFWARNTLELQKKHKNKK